MSRILWLGNAPWSPSGYGEQANLFIPRLARQGHEFAIAANHGLQGQKLDWNGVTCYPTDGAWGNTTLNTYASHHQADLVVALCDAWVLQPNLWGDSPPVALWAPIDHYPIPPQVLATLSSEKVRPIAMSRFGEAWMRRMGLQPVYVPHGVDTTVFKPDPEQRATMREAIGVPADAFLVGMVAANQGNTQLSRKAYPAALDAWARFARDHDDAWLYLHTRMKPFGPGLDLEVLLAAVDAPIDRVKASPEEGWHLGYPREFMAALYQCFDVLLNPSMGEGFGVPIVEAQACGVPVIVSDHSSMTELCHAGWRVSGDRWWDAPQASFFLWPSLASIGEALEGAYDRRDDAGLRESAVAFAGGYDADRVAEEFWRPALETLLRPSDVAPAANGAVRPNREQRRALAKTGGGR